jgi:hypothetical protein
VVSVDTEARFHLVGRVDKKGIEKLVFKKPWLSRDQRIKDL